MAALLCLCGVVVQAAQTALPAPPAQEAARADAGAVFRMRVVGGLDGLQQFTQLEEPFWRSDLPRLSGGRFAADIVPFDKAGVPGASMLNLLQMGVVPFGTVLLSALSAQYPQYMAADLAGLNSDMAMLRASVAVFRPYLQQVLLQQHGVQMLAIYAYPAQVLFCRKPLSGLSDLRGRRIRVSSSTQADFVAALGGVPVRTEFAQLTAATAQGALDCAITGTSSGNSVGLHRITSHLHAMPITWGLAIFGANQATWASLPQELRTLLQRELPQLEARVWDQAERETAAGMACNSGAPACPPAQRGRMVVVPATAADEALRRQVLQSDVLAHWLRRCSVGCADIWRQTIGSIRAVALPPVP